MKGMKLSLYPPQTIEISEKCRKKIMRTFQIVLSHVWRHKMHLLLKIQLYNANEEKRGIDIQRGVHNVVFFQSESQIHLETISK